MLQNWSRHKNIGARTGILQWGKYVYKKPYKSNIEKIEWMNVETKKEKDIPMRWAYWQMRKKV